MEISLLHVSLVLEHPFSTPRYYKATSESNIAAQWWGQSAGTGHAPLCVILEESGHICSSFSFVEACGAYGFIALQRET